MPEEQADEERGAAEVVDLVPQARGAPGSSGGRDVVRDYLSEIPPQADLYGMVRHRELPSSGPRAVLDVLDRLWQVQLLREEVAQLKVRDEELSRRLERGVAWFCGALGCAVAVVLVALDLAALESRVAALEDYG